jgi:hypothetical protein
LPLIAVSLAAIMGFAVVVAALGYLQGTLNAR